MTGRWQNAKKDIVTYPERRFQMLHMTATVVGNPFQRNKPSPVVKPLCNGCEKWAGIAQAYIKTVLSLENGICARWYRFAMFRNCEIRPTPEHSNVQKCVSRRSSRASSAELCLLLECGRTVTVPMRRSGTMTLGRSRSSLAVREIRST